MDNHEAALVRAFTAIELTISHLLFRPFFLGVFLSEEVADQIVQAILNRRGDKERQLLPSILKHWGIPLEQIQLVSGKPLWATITGPIRIRRNGIVHTGASAEEADALEAITAAELLLEKVVGHLARQSGFTLEITGKWSEIGRPPYVKTFPQENPFKDSQ
jgi:hypothetical protein